MRDSKSVITNAVKGIDAHDLADEMDVSTVRMYEILSKDCPYPRAKTLIKAIGKKSIHGAKLIQSDLNAMFATMFGETTEEASAIDLHREAFEAVQSCLENKCDGDKARELRELITVAQTLLSGLNAPDEMTPREKAEMKTRQRFAVV